MMKQSSPDDAQKALDRGRRADAAMDQVVWDERYRSAGALWSGKPNPHLVHETTDLPIGRALDAGCGEGADALWLAERGWTVTAVDFSTVALERGADRAKQAGAEVAARIAWIHADLLAWTPEKDSFDLVSIHFMHFPREVREQLYCRLAESVRVGGTLLVVGHHPSDLQTTVRRPREPAKLFTADGLVAELDLESWEVIVQAARERYATDPSGNSVRIHDTVLRARKLAR